MSENRDHSKQRKNEHLLKNLPTEVLLKARSTLFSLSGALKPKHEQQKTKHSKHEAKEKKKEERLKISRSEPEFSEVRQNKHRSRIDDSRSRGQLSSRRPRPLSVGAIKRYDEDLNDFHSVNFLRESSPMQRQFDSSEDMCVQSRLVIPVTERLNQDIQMHDVNERPRKKLSFREPEIESSGSATIGRSNKLMGINSLTRRPNKLPLRSEPPHASNLEVIESELESQAMRIVRTVGQAFEVCHKMQINTSDQPAPSTSSAPDEPVPSTSDAATSKEANSDCGPSETGAVSTTKVQIEVCAAGGKEDRPKQLELLPPPPKKEGKRMQQRTTPTPTINLPDLPECITKVEVANNEASGDTVTPLSAQHQLQLLRERLDQQAQQTRAAVAQLLLLRDQLAAEQAARCEAQARTHQLLVHNRELLEHIAALVAHLQEREKGSSRPISAQQLTLLPQAKAENATKECIKSDNTPVLNGNRTPTNTEVLINLITENTKVNESKENNNLRMSPFSVSPAPGSINGASSAPCFDGMTNEQIQNYLITKFENLSLPNDNVDTKPATVNYNQQFFQNSRAFPNIPPLTNHYSNSDLASLMNHKVYKDLGSSTDELVDITQAMSVGHSENSLYSTSQPSTSKDSSADGFSSDDDIPFIMPLSHNCTLTATSEDGRVRLIVPVSPSGSTSDVMESQSKSASNSGNTLKVPVPTRSTSMLAPTAPITRTTSEKVPNRSEMMAVLRSQWTRHTTK